MSYYSAFKIKDTSGLKIPNDVIAELINKIEETRNRIDFIDNIDDNTITGKEYKDYQKEKIILSQAIVVDFFERFKITNDYFTFQTYYDRASQMLYFDGKRISFMFDEGETFQLQESGDFYIGDGEMYSSSNGGWTQEMIETFIEEFKCSAIIEDMGDEEYGFVYEDGCSRDLTSPIIYKKGVLV